MESDCDCGTVSAWSRQRSTIRQNHECAYDIDTILLHNNNNNNNNMNDGVKFKQLQFSMTLPRTD